MRQLAADRRINPSDFVWRDSDKERRRAEEIRGLFPSSEGTVERHSSAKTKARQAENSTKEQPTRLPLVIAATIAALASAAVVATILLILQPSTPLTRTVSPTASETDRERHETPGEGDSTLAKESPKHITAKADDLQGSEHKDREIALSDLVDSSIESVVLVSSIDERGQEIATGSGFFVSPDGVVITNEHVIADAYDLRITDYRGATFAVDGIIARDDKADLAAIKVAAKSEIPHLELERSTPRAGERILAIGHPRGLSNSVSDGIISAVRELNGRKLIQMTAPISPGSSGGPVLSNDGRVVGVSTFYIFDGQNLNFAVSAETIADLLERAGSPVPLKTASEDKSEIDTGAYQFAWPAYVERMQDGEEFECRVFLSFTGDFEESNWIQSLLERELRSLPDVRIDREPGNADLGVYLVCLPIDTAYGRNIRFSGSLVVELVTHRFINPQDGSTSPVTENRRHSIHYWGEEVVRRSIEELVSDIDQEIIDRMRIFARTLIEFENEPVAP